MLAFQLYPLPFWLVLAALAFFAVRSWQLRESALRVPMLMILGTVAFWYVGDVLYNDYAEYQMEIEASALRNAWWEVLIFLGAFYYLTPWGHRHMNRKYLGKPSNLLSLVYYGGLKSDKLQNQFDLICRILLVAWIVLMGIGLVRVDYNFQGLFLPFLGEKADPWARGRLGGSYDALLAAAGYFQIGLAAAFGVIMALAYRPWTWVTAAVAWLLTVPTYIFDRTRNVILATILPAFLAWVFLRLRTGFLVKAAILLVGFLMTESWMKFIIQNRTQSTISAAFLEEFGKKKDDAEQMKHLGLNMFEELGFINSFIASNTYRPNWGARYFAELVNPVPRALWPGKPMIGIDYAIARGQSVDSITDDATGVGATVSTGMIGQGVVNFGRLLGPVAAAFLMALWACILARQDLLAAETGRLFLYAIGLILTFNMGRDITLLVIYPFLFGYLLLWSLKGWEAFMQPRKGLKPKSSASTIKGPIPSARQTAK